MAIDLTTFSARTRPTVRQPVYQQVNRMEADTKAAGKNLLMQAGANALQIISQQSALSARLKVKAGTDAYLLDYENELSKATGSDQAATIANKYLTGFEEHKAGLVREAEGGLINSALVSFGKAIEATSAGERQRVTNGILAVNAQRMEDITLSEYAVLKGKARTPKDTEGVLAFVTASRGALNEKFPTVWNEAVQDDKVMNFESAMLDVYNKKGIEASVAFGRDLNTAKKFGLSNTETTQIVNVFESDAKIREGQAKKQLEDFQYNTNKDTLVGIWNGSITDPDHITQLLDSGALTTTQASGMRKALLAPEDSDRATLASLNDSMTEYALGGIKKQEMLDKIIAAGGKISKGNGDALINDLEEKVDQTTAKATSDAYRSMEMIIGSAKGLLGNIVIGSDKEQIAYDQGKLNLDREIREARLSKKPMNREDILVRSIEISQEIKAELKASPREEQATLDFRTDKQSAIDRTKGKVIDSFLAGHGLTMDDITKGKVKTPDLKFILPQMNDAQKAIVEKLKAEGKTDAEIIELFNQR